MDRGLAEQASSEPKKPNRTEPNPFALSEHEPTKEANHEADEASSSSGYTSDDSDDDDDDEFFQLDPLGLDPPAEPTRSSLRSSSRTPPLHPKIQTDAPSPNRIPSSVFARTKSTSPMEWSVASNESLFSISAGNSSLSRDNAFVTAGTDGYTPPISPIPSPLPPTYPTVLSPSPNVSALETVDELEPLGAANDPSRVDAGEQADSGKEPEKGGVHFTESVSRLSDGSVASSQSFAFPVLTKDGGKSGSVRIQPEHQRMQSQTAEQQTPKVAGNIGHTAAADPVAPASPPAAESFGETTDQVAARRKQ